MGGNSFGKIFKVTTFGESHNTAVGLVVDGVPSNIAIEKDYIQTFLNERKPANNPYTSQRKEQDEIEIFSGIYQGKTLGTPIAMAVFNHDQKSSDYNNLKTLFRPSHADFSWYKKYGHVDKRGGGRASARETLARVAAGAIASKILETHNVKIIGFLESIGAMAIDYANINFAEIKNNYFFTPDKEIVPIWEKMLQEAIAEGDSYGAVVRIIIQNCPIGLGEPVFDKLNADLAKAIFSIPSVKGVEFGEGFALSAKKGSEGNDQMYVENGNIKFKTNHNGGIIGGISTGEEISIRIAIKPTSSISKSQNTVNENLENTKISIQGRHDPCIGIRAISVCKAMCNIVLVDHLLRNQTSKFSN